MEKSSLSLASEWCLHAQVTAARWLQGLGYRSARLSMPPATEGLAFVVKLRGTGALFAPEDGAGMPGQAHYSVNRLMHI
jgi:hypothetical protein